MWEAFWSKGGADKLSIPVLAPLQQLGCPLLSLQAVAALCCQ